MPRLTPAHLFRNSHPLQRLRPTVQEGRDGAGGEGGAGALRGHVVGRLDVMSKDRPTGVGYERARGHRV